MRVQRFDLAAPGATHGRVGTASIVMPSGLVLFQLEVCNSGPRWWVGSTASTQVGFHDHGSRRRFSDAAIAALRLSNPELFAGTTGITIEQLQEAIDDRP